MTERTRSLRLLVVAVALAAGGCTTAGVAVVAGAAIGLGVYHYIDGEMKRDYPHTVAECRDAVERALHKLEIPVSEADHDVLGGKVVARQADGTTVRVGLSLEEDGQTEIGVRVGAFGDEADSHRIHEEIARSFATGS